MKYRRSWGIFNRFNARMHRQRAQHPFIEVLPSTPKNQPNCSEGWLAICENDIMISDPIRLWRIASLRKTLYPFMERMREPPVPSSYRADSAVEPALSTIWQAVNLGIV
ncbi:MAG: hypothetical protein K0R67_2602 [Paenibacillus sp.]|nr:hypothetical protein [Paenibacillus sp.]